MNIDELKFLEQKYREANKTLELAAAAVDVTRRAITEAIRTNLRSLGIDMGVKIMFIRSKEVFFYSQCDYVLGEAEFQFRRVNRDGKIRLRGDPCRMRFPLETIVTSRLETIMKVIG